MVPDVCRWLLVSTQHLLRAGNEKLGLLLVLNTWQDVATIGHQNETLQTLAGHSKESALQA